MKIHFSHDELRPLIEQVVREVVLQVKEQETKDAERMAFTEPEAARMLGLNAHQLRDERIRGRIQASAIVGGRIRYQRKDLLHYLESRRWELTDK